MRLIDADALMPNAEYKGKNDFVSARDIANAHTIDAVPVVRCKDCINGKPLDNGDVIKCMMIGHNNPPHSYCWWGERREG